MSSDSVWVVLIRELCVFVVFCVHRILQCLIRPTSVLIGGTDLGLRQRVLRHVAGISPVAVDWKNVASEAIPPARATLGPCLTVLFCSVGL